MEKKLELNGRRNIYITEQKFKQIKQGILDGLTIPKVSELSGIPVTQIVKLFKLKYFSNNVDIPVELKKEPYYKNEKEIIEEVNKIYTWIDLTYEEKKFYLNYNKKNKL